VSSLATPSPQIMGMTDTIGRAYAGRTADERDAARRARLLAAARQVIGTEGYAATTIEKICSVASVSSRHFYQLYSTKEDAFIDLYRGLTDESAERAIARFTDTRGEPLPERIASTFVAYLGPMFDDLRAARIAFVEVVGVSPRVEQIRLDYREQLIGMVEAEGAAAVARGEITDRNFRFAALAMIGAATAVVYDWMLNSRRTPLEELQRSLADLAVNLLTA
jgi:AcrR family transcriptional regulator